MGSEVRSRVRRVVGLCSMAAIALVGSVAFARAEPAVGQRVSPEGTVTNIGIERDARDARLRFRSTSLGLGDVPDGAIRFRACDGLPGSHASGEYWLERIRGGRPPIAAAFELTGLSRLLVHASSLPPMARAKRERDLDDVARRFVFEFWPPLPVEMRTGRIHR